MSSRSSETTTLVTSALRAAGEILEEVVGHGAGGGCLLELEGDGVGFEDADPDGEDLIAGDVFEDDDGHVGNGVHHEAADLHLDFVGFIGDGMVLAVI